MRKIVRGSGVVLMFGCPKYGHGVWRIGHMLCGTAGLKNYTAVTVLGFTVPLRGFYGGGQLCGHRLAPGALSIS
jgi:hypothetical protein